MFTLNCKNFLYSTEWCWWCEATQIFQGCYLGRRISL